MGVGRLTTGRASRNRIGAYASGRAVIRWSDFSIVMNGHAAELTENLVFSEDFFINFV